MLQLPSDAYPDVEQLTRDGTLPAAFGDFICRYGALDEWWLVLQMVAVQAPCSDFFCVPLLQNSVYSMDSCRIASAHGVIECPVPLYLRTALPPFPAPQLLVCSPREALGSGTQASVG